MGIRLPKPGQSLADLYPAVAAQADGWDPKEVGWGSDIKLPWRCDKGHSWTASVVKRASAGRGCPYCSNNKVLAGFNDLQTHFPEVAREAHGWDPTKVSSKSKKKLEWKCSLDHVWFAAVGSRTAGGHGCPVCRNLKTVAGINDLQTLFPEIAQQAFGWNPNEVNARSSKKLQWKCSFGHLWTTVVSLRTVRGMGCPTCANQQLLVGFNDLATTHPDLSRQADGWNPTTVIAGTHSKKSWRCDEGHLWDAKIQSRARGIGCPICANKQVLVGFNDLATTHPDLARQADGWDPTTVIAGTHSKKSWRCDDGHLWEASPNKRAFGIQNGCPICANKQVLVGFNDLATTNPDLAREAFKWDPSTTTASSGKTRSWKCSEGHTWKSTVSNRNKGSGCPSCAIGGFDPNRDGWLYFIDHEELSMLQVGISNFPDTRLGQHSKRGWEVLEVRGPMEGHLAQELETAILHAVERRGAVLGHRAGIKRFDGYSEAWTKDSLQVSGLKQLLDWVYEDDKA